MSQTPSSPATPPTPSGAPARRSRGLLFWLLTAAAILVVLVGALLFFVGRATAGIEKQGKAFATAVVAADAPAAYALTSREFRATTDRAAMGRLVDQLAPLTRDGKLSTEGKMLSKSSGRSDLGVTTFAVKGAGGTIHFRVVLVKEAGSWKVLAFESSAKPLEATLPD